MKDVLAPGIIVEHSTWGLGKVVEISGLHVVVHFSSLVGTESGPRRKLQLAAPQLRVAEVQSDPVLDRVRVGAARARSARGDAPKPRARIIHTTEDSVVWFKKRFPGLFEDPELIDRELDYKREANQRWLKLFGRGRGCQRRAKI